jgi:hypothetical protein
MEEQIGIPELRAHLTQTLRRVRGSPLDDPVVPHEPLPGTPPSEDIVSQGRDED